MELKYTFFNTAVSLGKIIFTVTRLPFNLNSSKPFNCEKSNVATAKLYVIIFVNVAVIGSVKFARFLK